MDDVSAVQRFDLETLSVAERRNLLESGVEEATFSDDRIRSTIAAVRDGGDDALCRFLSEGNGVDLDPSELQIADGDFVHAFERLDPERTRRLSETVDHIRDFHEAELPQELWLKQIRPGQWAGHRHRPIEAAACYVPDGSDARSEAAVMNTVPALIAKVPRVVIVTPPEPDGSVSDLILVAAATVGVGEIYKLDALSAAAALAFGTERIPKIGKLMAPYDSVLVNAGRALADHLEIGLTSGEGSPAVLADAWADVDTVIANLAAITEMKKENSSIYLVSPSADLLDAVSSKWSGDRACNFILAPSMAVALSFVNELDPSYLCVCTIDPMSVLTSIDVVGEVHLRGASMMSFSSSVDHAAAPSISPRCRSSLSVFDFLQRTPISCQTHFTSEIAEGMPEPAASIGLP